MIKNITNIKLDTISKDEVNNKVIAIDDDMGTYMYYEPEDNDLISDVKIHKISMSLKDEDDNIIIDNQTIADDLKNNNVSLPNPYSNLTDLKFEIEIIGDKI